MRDLTGDAQQAWRVARERLYDARTNLFYDFVSRYEAARRFAHLPTPAEIARQEPNTNGWATGMEDSTISGGVVLAALCDAFAATQDEGLRPLASAVFAGLRLCGTLSSAEGLVLRSVSPIDGRSYYIETSRDQVTHFAHGLWRYYHSPLSTGAERTAMRDMVAALCRRMEHCVVPERDYHIGKENDEPGLVDRMWDVAPHEVGRLPMVYAVGGDLTADPHWRELYRRFAAPAAALAADLDPAPYQWCYPLFQHQVSLEVLMALESQDEGLRRQFAARAVDLAAAVGRFARHILDYRPADVEQVDMDWRTRPCRPAFRGSTYGHVAEWPEAMLGEFRPLREVGEALLTRLMAPGIALTAEDEDLLERALTGVDYARAFTCGMLYPWAAFWRYRRQQACGPGAAGLQ